MNPGDFIHRLHYETDRARPPNWEVDWEDAPLKVKQYRGLPVVPLSSEVPLTLERGRLPEKPGLDSVGHMLWYVYGLTQMCLSGPDLDSAAQDKGSLQWCRRFVPSGGALYPNEVYVYLNIEEAPAGVYHYDAAHHRLILLREGNFDRYVSGALGERCDVSGCFGTVFVSTVFWKNFFKYHYFSYRLQGLDAGVLIGQLLEVAKRFGFAAGVHYQFLDRAVNHLLGLSEREESVYAVIPLSVVPAVQQAAAGRNRGGSVSAGDLCRELPTVRHPTFLRSKRVKEYPLLIRMNEASFAESSHSFREIGGGREIGYGGRAFVLPYVRRMSYDLAAASRNRRSPDMDFVMREVNQLQLAAMLQEAAASFRYRNDLDSADETFVSRVSLYCCLHGMEGIPDGAYRYDSAAHLLQQIRPGDHRIWLQQAMSLHNVNLLQVPICLHAAGDRDHLLPVLGARGYRIGQMETGILVQRLLLAASALGMGGHPLLGFDTRMCDDIYELSPRGKVSLIQIPIGPYRQRAWLKGSLHG
ncbi:SagB family peptide dehydrogenase [Paenibacillus cymbidii]|uniref:SagB family peptide dehydrogenase n=1 Tax=Paenibacillus cymbidii TaxID=1639034 RepID=UPI001080CAFD|nr:SagB family peptide dehydrogenase [Paenibacillus cymbidii]